jgi:hypothetical protein
MVVVVYTTPEALFHVRFTWPLPGGPNTYIIVFSMPAPLLLKGMSRMAGLTLRRLGPFRAQHGRSPYTIKDVTQIGSQK